MHPLARRLLRLDRSDKHPPMAWLNPGETTEQARARWLADHPAEDLATELMFITWDTPVGGEIG
jgi:hypothetical protein